MRKITPYLILGLCCVAFYPRPAAALNFSAPKPKFGYRDASGKKQSIEVVDKYYPKKIVHPFGNDSNIDPKLRRAATIAEERARAHSLSKCWHYVKEALVAAGVGLRVEIRPRFEVRRCSAAFACQPHRSVEIPLPCLDLQLFL